MLSGSGSGAGLPPLDALFAPIAASGRVGLAVSGGPDSLALMLIMARWVGETGDRPAVTVYTVDHQLRPEARDEAAMVAREAAKLGFDARILAWTGRKPTTGMQAAARTARYTLIADAMAADGAEILLTAHHAADQAETVLMRLAHASGIGGLGGMADMAVRDGLRLFRPLLGIAPETLARIVREAGLTPAADPSNNDTAYERVRWRAAQPQLSALGLSPDRLDLFARRARRADVALEQATTAAARDTVGIDPFGAVFVKRDGLAALAEEIRIRLLQRALRFAGGGLRPFDLARIEALAADVRDENFVRRTLNGAMAERRSDHILVSREPGRMPKTHLVVPPAGTEIWDGRFRLENRSDVGIEVSPEPGWSRQDAERALGREITAPMVAVRTAPVVRTTGGAMLSVGRIVLDPAIGVAFAVDGLA